MKKQLLIMFIVLTGITIGQSLMAASQKEKCDVCAGQCIATTAENVAKCKGDAKCEAKAFEDGGKCSQACDKKYKLNPGCGTQMSQYQLSECVRNQGCV